jgi:hypothetical protein
MEEGARLAGGNAARKPILILEQGQEILGRDFFVCKGALAGHR